MNEPHAAIRAIEADLSKAIRREHMRRTRRRKAVRAGAAGVLVLTALSSAALAAGGAFKEVEVVTPVAEVELPQDVTIQAVDSYPEFVGRATSNGFVTSTGTAKTGKYLYHVTGGEARELGCAGNGVPSNNIYITSTQALNESEIRSLLQPDGQLYSPREKPRPPWITSTSDGCPNPGVAGQPGKTDEEPAAVKSAVQTPASSTTKILIRKKVRVPVGPVAGSGDEGQGTPSTPSPATPSSSNTTTGASKSREVVGRAVLGPTDSTARALEFTP